MAAEKTAAEAARQRADAERQAAEAAQQKALTEQQRVQNEARQLAEANRKKAAAAQLAAAAMPAPPRVAPGFPEPPRSPPAAPKPVVADPGGVYGGPICYAQGAADPARCFRAQAVLRNNTISGQWPARVPGATMHLAGDVTPSGEVAIHMQAIRADGSRFAIIDMVGKLREGRIEAAGSFRNGRHVTLNWRKD